MSTRLTNDLRDTIASDILRHRFSEQVDALIADRAAFAEAVYCDIYRKADREKMEALPKGWLPECSKVGVQFGSTGRSYETVSFDGSFYGPLGSMRTRVKDAPSSDRRMQNRHAHGCAKVYDDQHKLSIRHQELADRHSALKADFETAKRQTMAALASVSTIKRLIEAWPEVAPFATKHEAAPRQLPSVPTEKLNEMLGLPVAA